LPVLTMAQVKLDDVLVQPGGRAVRSVVRASCVAALPSSVVKLTLTDEEPVPATASICPDGDAVATTLSCAVAA
jgi:hypothetical protein